MRECTSLLIQYTTNRIFCANLYTPRDTYFKCNSIRFYLVEFPIVQRLLFEKLIHPWQNKCIICWYYMITAIYNITQLNLPI